MMAKPNRVDVGHIYRADVQTPQDLVRFFRILEAVASRLEHDRHMTVEERLVHRGRAMAFQEALTVAGIVSDHVSTFYTHNSIVEQMVDDAVALAEERWEVGR